MPLTWDQICRRAGGRRAYNAQRQFAAAFRLKEVAALLCDGLHQAEIARRLCVHPSTVCRDVKKLHKMALRERTCPVCGQEYLPWLRGAMPTGRQAAE